MNSEEQEIIAENKALIKEFPFLHPYRTYGDYDANMRMVNNDDDFDYTWTLLDDMPDGWRKAFGTQMCRELKTELVKENILGEYSVIEIKEKYGSLRWYDCGGSDETDMIVQKYEELSKLICIECGKIAQYYTTGWISPYCKDCVKSVNNKYEPIRITQHGIDLLAEYRKETGA